MVFKVLLVVSFPRCTAGPNFVGSCCIRLHTTAKTDATTPNIVRPTMLGIVACVLAVVCRRMQQLPTMLGPAVHRGKDTTHKSLQTMRNERAWPQQCWKSCANGSNIVALRLGDHRTKEMLGVVLKSLTGFKLGATTSNNIQQHATGCANGRNM